MRKIQITFVVFLLFSWVISCSNASEQNDNFVYYVCSPGEIKMYWKDKNGNVLGSIGNLKQAVEANGKKLKFAMNGGMFLTDQNPQGLYIEDGVIINPLNSNKSSGNFYWQPNGVFYINQGDEVVVCRTADFTSSIDVKYATQSGPMLVIDGNIHPEFKEGSTFVHIRNGVGVLPDGKVIMAISKKEVTLYDFAKFFKEKGCQNALYLDGFVSRMYCPEKGMNQLEGNFGVMIGVEN